jgi:hypothetical protein
VASTTAKQRLINLVTEAMLAWRLRSSVRRPRYAAQTESHAKLFERMPGMLEAIGDCWSFRLQRWTVERSDGGGRTHA